MSERSDTQKTLFIFCRKCGDRIVEPGALIFTPPTEGSYAVEKWHICASCWDSPRGPRASVLSMSK